MCHYPSFGQKKNSKGSPRLIADAQAAFEEGHFTDALRDYELLAASSPESSLFQLRAGVCLMNLQQPEKALPYLFKARDQGDVQAFYYIGRAFHMLERLDEAIDALNMFKVKSEPSVYLQSDVEKQIRIVRTAKKFMSKPHKMNISNLGKNVNSPYDDYSPVFSADVTEIFFTSRREGGVGNERDTDGDYFEDIYKAELESGTWQKPENLGTPINSSKHDAVISLSADGQYMLLYRTTVGYSGDLYIAALQGDRWSDPEKLNEEINSPYWEPSAALSPDGREIYFSSNRPGGYGGRDLYVSRKLPNGEWAKPRNLGPVINTTEDEDAPFMHPDGKTFYFSSRGHENMGSFDIFSTVKLEDNFWSEPANMGYPINTVGDDIFFVISADNDKGYYSSDKEGGYGKKDIYRIDLEHQSNTVVLMRGHLLNDSKQPLGGTLTVMDHTKNIVEGVFRSNSLTGKYILVLNAGKSYKIVFEHPEYFMDTELVTLDKDPESTEMVKDVVLKKK
jgi:tetratricopeptide (TPR) repeat protein